MQGAAPPASPVPHGEVLLDVKAASWAADEQVALNSRTFTQLLRETSTHLSHPATFPCERPRLLVSRHS
jgi:hypothetical protein